MVDDFGLELMNFFHVLDKSKSGTVADHNEIIIIADKTALKVILVEISKR